MNTIALAFVKAHEGCRLTSYRDSAGVWTIGYGATGSDIVEGLTWTQAQADNRLGIDLSHAANSVRQLATVKLSDQQSAALISFVFNLGDHALRQSSLLEYVNASEFIAAAKEFPRWDRGGGKELKGLLIRRFEEAALFLKGS